YLHTCGDPIQLVIFHQLDYIYGKSKDISNLAELYPRTGTSIEQDLIPLDE
ncbi:MAG: hypothetical protein EZS28_045731, partial [Streblomastix strix]